jgi:hypothetical protein
MSGFLSKADTPRGPRRRGKATVGVVGAGGATEIVGSYFRKLAEKIDALQGRIDLELRS